MAYLLKKLISNYSLLTTLRFTSSPSERPGEVLSYYQHTLNKPGIGWVHKTMYAQTALT